MTNDGLATVRKVEGRCKGPSPLLCEQPDGTALPHPGRPVINVMPRNIHGHPTSWSGAGVMAGYPVGTGGLTTVRASPPARTDRTST